MALAIDLYCGLGGWAEGLLSEGWDVIGFDIEGWPYPGQLVLQDVQTLHGAQFKNAALIVASPPCQAYSYRAMPWKRAKALGPPDNTLFETCFRIQREASEAAGHHIPLIVENVRGAQKYVGWAKWHYGSYYLWGDIPALMPIAGRQRIKSNLGTHDRVEGSGRPRFITEGVKLPNNNAERRCEDRPIARLRDATKQGGEWWHDPDGIQAFSSHSNARKQASALIAKIPFALAQHIARVFRNGN